MTAADLEQIAGSMVAPGKGILAADESLGTIAKRFSPVGIENSEDTRRAYRELLFTTPGLSEFISGVILFDETLRQNATTGRRLAEILGQSGILPGIKVDKGTKALPGHPGELVTEGLDGLGDRLSEYRDLGATFAKWRAVLAIADGLPSRGCIGANAEALARYASACQTAGLVPIVEPEVLMDGAHSIEQCFEVTEATLRAVFAALHERRVVLEQMVLKPNMVVSGKSAPVQAGPDRVAELTLRCLRRTVPAAVPGIAFLSGGQTEVEATANLNAMNASGASRPWELTFSYGRALQDGALRTWAGRSEEVARSQAVFRHRARCNSAARFGKWSPALESSPS